MKKIVVLISGRGSNFVAIEECALREDWEHTIGAKIVAVISNRPDAKGLELAKGYGIDALCVDHKAFETREAFEEKLYEVISQYSPDLIVLAGFMRILTAGFVDRFEGKILNIHPALLPKFGGKGMYGMHVHEAVVAAGERETGITIHYINEQYDEGAILFQAKCPLLPTDTPEGVAAKVHALEYQYYPQVIERLLV